MEASGQGRPRRDDAPVPEEGLQHGGPIGVRSRQGPEEHVGYHGGGQSIPTDRAVKGTRRTGPVASIPPIPSWPGRGGIDGTGPCLGYSFAR
ncbi:MAG: hypothetical protein M0C28_22735 [Candidatus Moduliflexus flocculans]|nr:hypothetical protein [Candidatus Moduliflexus flocculans]